MLIINESLYKDESLKNEIILDEVLTKEQHQKDKILSKRQRKRMAQKASKLSKKSKNLRIEINDLRSQRDDLEDKIKRASSSTSAKFKGRKILSMKRESTKLNERIQEKRKNLRR